MGTALDRLAAVLLDGAVGAFALLGMTALVMVACGQPARRCLLARLAFLGTLVVVPLAIFAPMPRWPVRAPFALLAAPTRTTEDRPRGVSIGDVLARPESRAIMFVALGGTAVGFATILLGGVGCCRLLRRTIEPAPETLAIYESLPFDSPLPRPRLRVSARARSPVLVGTFRATIVIPTDLDEPDQAGPLRLSLLHELAHAERLDPWFGLIAAMAGAFWFFLPPLWWMRRQMRLDQEFLADRRASGKFGPPISYASSLLGLAQSGPAAAGEAGESGSAGASGSAAGGSSLFHRVMMLIRCPYPVETHAPRWWRWTCVPILACGTVLASGLTVSDGGDSPHPLGSSHRDGPEHGVLQIARLLIPARPPGPDGRVPPYTLLRQIPPRFELIVEVWANPADLPRIAIAGRRLGPCAARAADPAPVEGRHKAGRPRDVGHAPDDSALVESYHKVRLVRDDRGLALWVAGRPVPPQARDLPPDGLLAVQPAPGEKGRYRNLILAW